jgi:hypothetical protein
VRVKTREFIDKDNAALSLFEFKIQKFLKPRKHEPFKIQDIIAGLKSTQNPTFSPQITHYRAKVCKNQQV